MSYVMPLPPVPSLPVVGGEPGARFPVRRIYCVGRNYVDHAIEMGGSGREAPFFFMKPGDAVLPVAEGELGQMHYPGLTRDLHHEVELVAAIGRGGRDIRPEDALAHVWGYAVGLDMTRRDLQTQAKKHGRPWEIAKAFEHSAPCGPIHPASEIGHPREGAIRLAVNGATRQDGDLNQMIWKVPEMISYLSRLFTLAPGDLIFAGTPAGVGAVERGDVMRAHIDGLGEIAVTIL